MDTRKRILIMDDDSLFSAGLADLIRHFGLDVDCATTGEGGVRRLQEKAYSALLVDQGLEDEGGERILSWLRENRREESVVMMSAEADYEMLIDYVNRGAADLLAKPIQSGPLRRALQLALGEKVFAECG